METDAGSPIRPGDSFGDLEVLERIGQGSFSVVYRAHDTLIDRPVALKVLSSARWSDHEVARDEILKEARMVARVLDPHVVTLYRIRSLPNEHWAFEMEYLNGGSLSDYLKHAGPLAPGEARRILDSILRGLDAAHQHGIVHHDIKPGNVLLGKDGAVKLTDFGLGRFVAEDDLARGPRGHLRGTPYYMAPEVVMGRPAEMASDLWSVGVVLYRMLTGRLPFPGRTTEALFLAIQNATPAPLPDATPPQLAGLALSCLAKNAADRPASAAAVLEELARQGRTFGTAAVDPLVAGGPPTLLVGRERELAVFRAHLGDAENGLGRAALVLGEAGIGKTALLQAVGREARSRGFRWVEVRLSPLEGLRRPLAQALHDTVMRGDDLSDPSATPSGSISSRGFEVLRRLMADGPSASAELPLQSSWEIEQALLALAETRPLALLIEDVHLCDPEELTVLAALCAALASAPVYLAMTWRTSDPGGSDSGEGPPPGYYDLASAPEVERLEVAPLDDRAIRALLEQASGLPTVPLQLIERVIRDSDGVPLYALELYRHLEASGEVQRDKEALRITSRWGQAQLPGPLRDMVRRRLAGLSDEERTLLDTAAVAGVSFDGAWLAEVMDEPLLGVLRTLQRLYRERALVVPQEQGYRFGHALYQEAIYEEMAPDLRRALHRAWAEALEPKPQGQGVDPEALGWHWEQAGDPVRATPALASAAAAAASRGEHARAWRLAVRAGALEEQATPEQLRENFDLLVSLASTFTTEEDARRIEALYERLALAAATLEDEEMRRRVLVADAWHHVQRASGKAIDLAALEDAATHLPVSSAQATAWWLVGRVLAGRGAYGEARQALERADAVFQTCDTSAGGAQQSLHTLGSILRQECDFEAAVACFDRLARAGAGARGKTPQAALSRASAIQSAAQAGRTDGSGDALDEPIRWLERAGQAARAAHVTTLQAQLYEAEGRVADAREALRRAEPTLREAVLGITLWSHLRAKARIQIAAGELEAAEPTLRDAEAAQGNLEDVDRVALDQQRAFFETVLGEHEQARSRLLAALDLIAPTPHLLDLGRLLVEMIQLAALGLDLSAGVPVVKALLLPGRDHPPMLDLALRIASVVWRTNLQEVDAGALERAAAATRDPRLGCYQATLGAVASLFSARANLLGGERNAAASLLLAARQRAQQLQHVWLELSALQTARDADLDVDPVRVRALVDRLKTQNPADARRTAQVIAAWTSGMPRA